MKPNTNVPEFWYNIAQAGAFANTDQTFGIFAAVTYGDNGRYLTEDTWLGAYGQGGAADIKIVASAEGSIEGQVFTPVRGLGGSIIYLSLIHI